ncbi:MAG: hypothetical protein ACLPVW_15950, partial [Terriglobales bacterium]
ALHQPVPRPTRAAVEASKKEEASRREEGILAKEFGTFEKGPDVSKASRVGEPSMVDPEPVTATGVVQRMALAARGGSGDNKVSVETTSGVVQPNQEAPRSDTPAATSGSAMAPEQPASAASVADPKELKPNVEADPTALPPLQQSNQLDGGASSSASSSAPAKTEELADISSSKKKKKKGLAKLNPF